MSITTKKIQIYPIGDKEEINRVFEYLRNGIYNQHHILNTYMSQVGTLYYVCNKDFKSAEFKEQYNAIFRNTNTAIYDMEQAKGLGMAGNCGMRVKQDFSTALKNGLAKGERQLPYYKRDFPLLVPSRFINFYTTIEEYKDDNGDIHERKIFAFKFVNGIHFKVILGSRGKKDWFITSLLDSIITDPENYKVCGSTIQISNKGKIIFNITVKISKEAEKYEPVKDRVMGLSMGYDKCLVAALSDSDEMFTIGDNLQSGIVEKRIAIQEHNRILQAALRDSKGGHGRKRKMRDFDAQGSYEKNFIKHYNHLLSKSVVEFAKNHKVECIVVEDINKSDLENHPVLLRNWSFYQLNTFINYKANREGIKVESSKSKDASRIACCKCGCKLDEDDIIPKEIEWCHELSFICPSCNEKVEYSYNKAKNISVMG